MIPCKLQLSVKNKFMKNDSTERRYGHYINSFYPIKGIHSTCWVVVVNILVNYEEYLNQGLAKEEIASRCVEFLNDRPPSKYGKKRRRKRLYGNFRSDPYSYKFKENDKGEKFIQAYLVVEEQKNKTFWGEGRKETYSSCRKKRR